MASSHTQIIGPGKMWPPEEDRERIKRMRMFRLAYNASEPSLLFRNDKWKSDPVETFTSPLLKMTALSYANLICGEPIQIALGSEASDDARLAKARILRDSKFRIVSYNAAIAQSVEGEAYLKVRRGKLHSRAKKERVYIDLLNARSVIKIHDAGNPTPSGFVVYHEMKIPEQPGIQIIRFETHYPGEIVHEIYRINKMGQLGDKLDFGVVMGYTPDGMNADGVQPSDADDLLVSEIQNLETNGWSMPDLYGMENVVRLIEDRLSRDTEILNKHASPKLAVPPGLLNEKGQINRVTFDNMVFEVSDSGSGLLVPQYITWEPRLTESMEYFDKVLSIFLAGAGLTHQIVGIESKQGFADTGTALKLRMIPTLARVSGKTIQMEPAIDSALRVALELANDYQGYGSTMLDENTEIMIGFRDGLPEDPEQTARITQIRTANGRTMSTRSAILANNPDMSDETIDKELQAIREEEIVPEFGAAPRSPVAVNLDEVTE